MTALNNQVLCGRIVNVSFKLVVRVKLLQGKFVISYASNFDLVILGSPAQDWQTTDNIKAYTDTFLYVHFIAHSG